MEPFTSELATLLERGGWVMIPLLALSVVSVMLIIERTWFWTTTHRPGHLARVRDLGEALRRGERAAAARLANADRSPYGRLVRRLLNAGATEAVAIEAVEAQRTHFDRFMVTLSTIITAAPMLGILGTVTGIIHSFDLLGQQSTLTDPRSVSAGIAEALITTAVGLVIALMTLFPYMIFRGQVERAMGRMESLIAAAQQGQQALSRSGGGEQSAGAGHGAAAGRTEATTPVEAAS